MADLIKVSSPETHGFWELPVLFEDTWLLAVNKPAELATVQEQPSTPVAEAATPDNHPPAAPEHPPLLALLHQTIKAGKPWASERNIDFLGATHRVDAGTSGALLLAKDREAAGVIANTFGSEKPFKRFLALVQGSPLEDRFEVDAPIGPHHERAGVMKIDPRYGKKARTTFEVVERFSGWTMVACMPWTDRPHQIRVHLRKAGYPLVADPTYRGGGLMLSSIKRDFRLKPNKTERPLMLRPSLHLDSINAPHPVTKEPLTITAPLPKDLSVALKYLRKYAL